MSRTWTPAQQDAITVQGKTLLVSAAAGSGKTSVLTERIIRTLTDPVAHADLSRLLVVTFTRAAAAELKGRIAEALSKALAENPDNTHLSDQLLKLGSAQISTIDSFFQKIVRANFEKLGLGATFRIADEAEILPISMEVLDGVIADFYEKYDLQKDETELFSSVQSNRFAQALDHLLSNRSDGKLNDTLLDFYAEFSSYPDGIEFLKRCAQQLRQDAKADFMQSSYGKSLAAFFAPLFEDFTKDLTSLEQAMAYDPEAHAKCLPLIDSDRSFCQLVCNAFSSENYQQICAVANSFYSGKFPSFSKATKPKEVENYQNWRVWFKEKGVDKLKETFSLPHEIITQHLLQTADFCEILYEFYAEYQTRLLAEKNVRGVLEHNDVRSMVYRLLTDPNGSPSEFANSLGSTYDAVYIDEYQDVDAIQDRIFSLIGGDHRFMVGDIKQSIYGFRGSDPSIFASYRRNFPLYGSKNAETASGNSIFMSENFRCDQPVIDFTNQVCSFLFSACENSVSYRPEDDLKHAKNDPEAPLPGYPSPVQVAVFDKVKSNSDSEESEESGQEADWIAAEISRLLREGRLDNGAPIQPKDIAILVRDKNHGKKVTQAIQALSIPISSEHAVDFLHDPVLMQVINLLRCIDNPYRDLPLSEFLLSPMGEFTPEELMQIRDAGEKNSALFDALVSGKQNPSLSALSPKITSFCSWLDGWREQAAVLAADRFLRLLYLDPRLVQYASTPPLLMLYDQARLYQKSSWCGLYGFLQHIDKLMDGKKISAAGFAKAENAVTVMTIHHSKGLEFPVVFLVSCGAAFNNMDAREPLVFHPSTGVASKLYNRQTANQENTTLRMATLSVLKMNRAEESIRTLYVALTRARERLYVTGTLSGKWEKAVSTASCIHKGNRGAILSCNSYLAWILAVRAYCEDHGVDFPCTFRHYLPEEAVAGVPWQVAESEKEDDTSSQFFSDTALRYAGVLNAQADFSYPLEILRGLPTKAAASKLSKNLLDSYLDETDSTESIEAQIALLSTKAPAFDSLIRENQRPNAAEIGTVTHSFLEFCDYQKLVDHGVTSEVARMVEQRFISQKDAALLHIDQLEAFQISNLMDWIHDAKKVHREQKFSLSLPLSCLTSDPAFAKGLGDHTLYVQGSIDLLLETQDGQLLLIDYKTDHITEAERKDLSLLQKNMKAKHGAQLSYYAMAVEQLFGKAPDHTYVYSLPLGKAIEIK